MIGAPNTRGQKYWVGIVQWAAETSVSEEIADILTNYNIDDWYYSGYIRPMLNLITQTLIPPIYVALHPGNKLQ